MNAALRSAAEATRSAAGIGTCGDSPQDNIVRGAALGGTSGFVLGFIVGAGAPIGSGPHGPPTAIPPGYFAAQHAAVLGAALGGWGGALASGFCEAAGVY